MLNYSNVIENDKSYPGLQMREIKPVMKLIIRGKKRKFLYFQSDYILRP